MLKRFAAVILFLLPLQAYAQVGPGPVPYRGVNNWNVIFGTDNLYNIGAVGGQRPANVYVAGGFFGPNATIASLTATRCTFAGAGGLLSDDADCTFSGSRLTVTDFTGGTVTDSALTSGRVTLAGTAGLLADDADLTFSGSRLTATDATVTNFPTFSAGTNTRVPFFGASGVVTDDADMTFDGTILTSTRSAHAAAACSAPAITFGDADSGICNAGPAGTNIGISVNSAELFRCSTGAACSFFATLVMGANHIQFTDVGLIRQAAGVLRVSNASTGVRGLLGGGTAVASATAMPLPTGNVFHVTGTTNITSITSTNFGAGVCITLIFDGVLTFTDGSNLVLAGNFVTTADDTISLCFDGTSWFETARSVN